jgi:CRP-like cAMP-binding protein
MNDGELINYYVRKYNLNDILDMTLRENLKIYRFKPGQHIALHDEPLERFYFFVEGKAKVYSLLENGKSLLVRFYKPLEIIGEVELFSSERNICNLQAITDVCCIGIPSEIVRRSCKTNHLLLEYFCRSLSRKLLNFNVSSAINLMYPLENRLAGYLIAVSDFEGENKSSIEQIHTDNLSELADLLGTSYRHLNRTIKKFTSDGVIQRRNRRFEIQDWDKLRELAREIYT